MANYVVGDIQGCYDQLARLLDHVNFDTNEDTLFCVGDLVNRGPKSLKTLRFLKSFKNQCVTVLGNHDIHLLSMIYGIRQPRSSDTLNKVLKAHDVLELADWLRSRPLMVVNKESKFTLSHAGIYPWWSLEQAMDNASLVERVFRDESKCIKLLSRIYSNKPDIWSENLRKTQKRRFIINAFTRMRFCSPKGHLNFTESGFEGKSSKTLIPWFNIKNPSLIGYRVIFGHWSALGLLNTNQFLGLDTGCVWGREMTMAKIPNKPDQKLTLFTQK